MDISFLTINKENKDFELLIKFANEIWIREEVFGNKYEEYECPGNILVIGFTRSTTGKSSAVCATVIERNISGNKAVISCMGAYPQNCGYGSSLMQYIIKFLKNLCITEICLKIDKNDKAKRLEKFYINYGFTTVEEDKNKVLEYDEILFYYDSKVQYIMSYKLDLDIDITNLKIDI